MVTVTGGVVLVAGTLVSCWIGAEGTVPCPTVLVPLPSGPDDPVELSGVVLSEVLAKAADGNSTKPSATEAKAAASMSECRRVLLDPPLDPAGRPRPRRDRMRCGWLLAVVLLRWNGRWLRP